MSNKERYTKAWQAIKYLFVDRSVSKEKAIENLELLKEEIESLIEGLRY